MNRFQVKLIIDNTRLKIYEFANIKESYKLYKFLTKRNYQNYIKLDVYLQVLSKIGWSNLCAYHCYELNLKYYLEKED